MLAAATAAVENPIQIRDLADDELVPDEYAEEMALQFVTAFISFCAANPGAAGASAAAVQLVHAMAIFVTEFEDEGEEDCSDDGYGSGSIDDDDWRP